MISRGSKLRNQGWVLASSRPVPEQWHESMGESGEAHLVDGYLILNLSDVDGVRLAKPMTY